MQHTLQNKVNCSGGRGGGNIYSCSIITILMLFLHKLKKKKILIINFNLFHKNPFICARWKRFFFFFCKKLTRLHMNALNVLCCCQQ